MNESYCPKPEDTSPEPDVHLKHRCIVLKRGQYLIELERIDNPLKLVWWIHHLTGKDWADNKVIRRVIEIAIKKMSLKMYEGQG